MPSETKKQIPCPTYALLQPNVTKVSMKLPTKAKLKKRSSWKRKPEEA